MLYPEPKQQNISAWLPLSEKTGVCLVHNEFPDENAVSVILSSRLGGEGIALSIHKSAVKTAESSEAFTLSVAERGSDISADISCSSPQGLVHGLFLLKKMLDKGSIFLGRVTDYPLFEKRGCIEGFYGKPWSHAQRLEMIEFTASKGENCVYYAPKDDPFHRRLWRESYPEELLERLKELVCRARVFAMEFTYCIAPGLSIGYSDEEDFALLCKKLRELYSIGIKSFGLLFDDIPQNFSNTKDRSVFENLAQAQAYLCGRVLEFLKATDSTCTLTVCPTVYWGRGDGDYEKSLGNALPEEVLFFFTGRDICSREITCEDARYIKECTGHSPLYWDNFPVNDAEMFKEMHIAPVNGRDGELYKYCSGLLSNCMEYFNCSKIPLMTVADYLWSPLSYEPETSFENAVNELFRESEAEAVKLLFDHFRTSCLRDENSRLMGEYLSPATALIANGEPQRAIESVREYTRRLLRAEEIIRKSDSPIFSELKEWSEKFFLMTEIMKDSLSLLESLPKISEEMKKIIKKKMDAYNNLATVLTAFCFREYIETLLECI